MLEESVKLSGLIIFYFISNFLIYSCIYAPILPNREPKTSAFRIAVFSFLEQFSAPLQLFRSQKQMCWKRQPLRFFLETGSEGNQILCHLDGAFDWLPVSFFVY